MGIRQEHGKVLKLQVVQALYGMIPYHERAEHEASFESAYRHILGEAWDQSGLSMESVDGLGHYLRGIHSAKGTPVRLNQGKLMRGLALRTLSLESRLESMNQGSLAGAMLVPGLCQEAEALFKRYGLDGLSTEGKVKEVLQTIGAVFRHVFDIRPKQGPKKEEKPFDPKNVDWSDVHKIAGHIETASFAFKDGEDHVQKEGKISGEGIVKNLTWGTEFDEKDPVGFVKKKFAEWEKFYHAYETVIDQHSKAIVKVEETTRPAAMKARDDVQALDAVLDKGITAMKAAPQPAKVVTTMKPVFPGGRVSKVEPATWHNPFGYVDVVDAKGGKDIKELRPLTQAEARELLTWLKERVLGMKQYTTIFDKATWSDHSDGDEFWDVIESATGEAMYGSMIYWQSNHMDLLDQVDDISVILMHLSNGIMNWVDRSFPNT